MTGAEATFVVPSTIPEIDARLTALYAEITALKTKRNSLVPVFRLPNEILAHIIELYALATGKLFDLKWTNVMLVCRRWYQLAISAQRLWSFVDGQLRSGRRGRESALEAQLERAGAAPLTFKINLFSAWEWMYPQFLAALAPRLRSLEADGAARFVLELLDGISQGSLAQLVSLKLSGSYKVDEIPAGRAMKLGDEFFDGRAPNLRKLELTDMPFPWALVNNLHTLYLYHCSNSSSDIPSSLGDLLHLLRNSPTLRFFKFNPSPAHRLGVSPIANTEPVDLPLLQYLHVLEGVATCTRLLEYLRFPSDTVVDIFAMGSSDGNSIRQLIVPLRRHLRLPDAPDLRTLRVITNKTSDGQSFASATIHLTTATAPYMPTGTNAEFYPEDKPPSLNLGSHPATQPEFRQIATKVLHAAVAERITCLDATGALGVNEASWATVISLLPALTWVQLCGHASSISDCIAALFAALSRPSTWPRRVSRLTLTLLKSWMHPEDNNAPWVGEIVDALEGYVSFRRSQFDAGTGTPLELLEFEDKDFLLHSAHAHRQAMVRIFWKMHGMGTIVRGGEVWDVIENRKRHEKFKARMAKVGIEISDGEDG
ncbi:F-box domain-containing protein [Mycena chlorophos]|uniref:F-box domain-containing protein n=1 Tax=Mycena chlorophos TaxID=658473 RepID=A0A8H6SK75_MYCCL|nr:F-box domain-containing protein [Mycena chlorophos]